MKLRFLAMGGSGNFSETPGRELENLPTFLVACGLHRRAAFRADAEFAAGCECTHCHRRAHAQRISNIGGSVRVR
jgi:hypothetical protein